MQAASKRATEDRSCPPPADGKDLWVFAYGSLIWDPGFPFEEARPALLRGYHRAFCLYSTRYRGTPERPGLVLGLDRGGACRGVAFRVPGRHAAEVLRYLDDQAARFAEAFACDLRSYREGTRVALGRKLALLDAARARLLERAPPPPTG